MKKLLAVLLALLLGVGVLSIPASAEEIVVWYGDVDLNDQVNASDALKILKHAVWKVSLTPEEILLADVNEDQTVDAKDALNVLKFAVGTIELFPNGYDSVEYDPAAITHVDYYDLSRIHEGEDLALNSANDIERTLELINQKRAAAGLNAVTLDFAACNATGVLLNEMKNTDFDMQNGTLTRADGGDWSTVLDLYQVDWNTAIAQWAWGEPTPQSFVDDCWNSDTQSEMMKDPTCQKVGMCFYYDKSNDTATGLIFYIW